MPARRLAPILAALALVSLPRLVASPPVPASLRAHATSRHGPHVGACPVFPASNPLNNDISHAPVDPSSARYIASIGPSVHLHADFGTNPAYGIPYEVVPARQRKVPASCMSSTRPTAPAGAGTPAQAPYSTCAQMLCAPTAWTSADAAGLPILPLLARYQEAKAGYIDHALRVTFGGADVDRAVTV